MSNINPSSTNYNYYSPSQVQNYQSVNYNSNPQITHSNNYSTINHQSYYDPAAIAIANATGINPNLQSSSNHQLPNFHKSLDTNFDNHLAAQQSIYTTEQNSIQQQQQNQQNQQQQQQQINQSNQKLNKGKARTTVIRKAGGEVWEDQTLMEWDPAHFRLFVGDLAPEVSDDGLAAAFSKWTSFVKARVVRDKVTTKSKGYGFVSYKDPEDFMKAWKEMNGKYVGSRPIKISKATTKVGIVQIGNKKARQLDDHRKKKLIQGVERLRTGAGAVWKNDNRPYARR